MYKSGLKSGLVINLEKAKSLEHQFALLSEELQRDLRPTAKDFLNTPEIFSKQDFPTDEVFPLILTTIKDALESLLEMRAREGADLKADFHSRIETLSTILSQVTERAPLVLQNYRDNLLVKLGQLSLPSSQENLQEDERIIKEIALFAERADISEEITRFQSHLDKFHEYLDSAEPVGRSLDFLCQELHRELNTIGSKANDAPLSHLVVTGKTEVEKIREQVQNVE